MEVWKKSPLFHGMTEQKIEEILMQEQCRRKKYEKFKNSCLCSNN